MNLVTSLLSPLLRDNVRTSISNFTGSTEEDLNLLLKSAIAVQLGILLTLFRGESTASIWQAVREADEHLNAEQLHTLLDAGRAHSLGEAGQIAWESILGRQRFDQVLEQLSRQSIGTRGGLTLLIPVLTPYLLGALSSQLNSPLWSYNMSSLAMLLESQRAHVSHAVAKGVFPALAKIPGLNGLQRLTQTSLPDPPGSDAISLVPTIAMGTLVMALIAVLLGVSYLPRKAEPAIPQDVKSPAGPSCPSGMTNPPKPTQPYL